MSASYGEVLGIDWNIFPEWKLAADADHETVVSVEESASRGKRDRDVNVMQTLQGRQDLHKFLEWKAAFAVRREKSAQKRLSEAETEMEIRNWERTRATTITASTGESMG